MENFKRKSLNVQAVLYEPGKGLEDGFELYTKVITNGWITTDNIVQIVQDDKSIVCPFIENRRGRVFIRKGDYIIYESDSERHVCGGEKFFDRFEKA